MTSSNTIEVPGVAASSLEALAEQDGGISCERYTERSLRLGIYLATVLLKLDDPERARIGFLSSDGPFDVYPLSFDESNFDRPVPVDDVLAQLEPRLDPLILEISPRLMGMSEKFATIFDCTQKQFAEKCYALKKLYDEAMVSNSKILILDGGVEFDANEFQVLRTPIDLDAEI